MNDIIQKYSAGGIVYSEGKILAIRAIPQNEIILPKGTIEPGETPEQTAVREVFEETGYKTTVKKSLGTVEYEFSENGKYFKKTVHHFLLGLVDKTALPTPHPEEGEVFENLWLTPDEGYRLLTHADSKELLRKAVDYTGGM